MASAELSLQPLAEDGERAAHVDPAVGRSIAQRHLPQPGQAKTRPARPVGTRGPWAQSRAAAPEPPQRCGETRERPAGQARLEQAFSPFSYDLVTWLMLYMELKSP